MTLLSSIRSHFAVRFAKNRLKLFDEYMANASKIEDLYVGNHVQNQLESAGYTDLTLLNNVLMMDKKQGIMVGIIDTYVFNQDIEVIIENKLRQKSDCDYEFDYYKDYEDYEDSERIQPEEGLKHLMKAKQLLDNNSVFLAHSKIYEPRVLLPVRCVLATDRFDQALVNKAKESDVHVVW